MRKIGEEKVNNQRPVKKEYTQQKAAEIPSRLKISNQCDPVLNETSLPYQTLTGNHLPITGKACVWQ